MKKSPNLAALEAAEAAVEAAGFSPDPVGSSVSFGRAFACSSERAGHGADRGPVFTVTVDVATIEVVFTTGAPRSCDCDELAPEDRPASPCPVCVEVES